MNYIREWAIMLCSVSVGSVFISFLIPDGNMKKSVNFAVSLFLMTIIIIPVCGKEAVKIDFPDISVDKLPDKEYYQTEYSKFLQSFLGKELENQISELLNKLCTSDYDIQIESYIDAEGNTVVSDIYVFLSQGDSKVAERLKSDVENLTGIIPQVVIDN